MNIIIKEKEKPETLICSVCKEEFTLKKRTWGKRGGYKKRTICYNPDCLVRRYRRYASRKYEVQKKNREIKERVRIIAKPLQPIQLQRLGERDFIKACNQILRG